MKLFYVPNSPYARITRIVAIEADLDDALQLEEVTLRDPESKLLAFSPVGRVPTLQTDDGAMLGETTVVSAYLDDLNRGDKIIPGFGPEDMPAQWQQSTAMGLLDGIMTWLHESRKGDIQSPAIMELETARAQRTLDAFEAEAAVGALDRPLHIGQITLASALGFCDVRFPGCNWRDGRPNLVAWYEQFAERPSMQKTVPLR